MASAKALDPQTWNRCAYARINPLTYIDPSALATVNFQLTGEHGFSLQTYGILATTEVAATRITSHGAMRRRSSLICHSRSEDADTLHASPWHNVGRGELMNAANVQIGDWLGVRAPSTETEILRIVEGGLAPAVISRLAGLGLDRSEIDGIVIPSRTLQHRRSRRENLTLEESDRVLRAIRVLSSAEAVYESRERALLWLRRPHPRLQGRAPLSLLKTDTGSRIVEELLIQIDEGMFI